MKRHFTLMGHANVTLGIILDSLYSKYGSELSVDIVSNLAEDENPKTYLHDKIASNEVYYRDWQPVSNTNFLLTGMSPGTKRVIFEFFLKHCAIDERQYTSVVHNSAVICNGVEFNGAVNISPATVVAQYAKLAQFVTVNRNVSIGHHTEVDEYTTISPGCNIGGHDKIGKNVVIGIGATLFNEIDIGDNAIIGGGSVVTKSVPANTLVYGVPAKVIKKL